MARKRKTLPMIPLRGITIFPYMVLHFDVGRDKSIASLDEAMLKNQEIFLVPQKDSKIENPTREDLLDIGTLCVIRQLLKLPGNTVRVLVEGIARGKLTSLKEEESFRAVVEILEDEETTVANVEEEALVRSVKESLQSYVRHTGYMPQEALVSLEDIHEPGRFADTVASYLMLKPEDKQVLLESLNIMDRLEKLLVIINKELEIAKIEKRIGTKVKSNIDKVQKEYYLREQLKAIQEELGEYDEDAKEFFAYKEKITKAKMPKEAKEKALYELDRLRNSGSYSAEGGIIRTYLDWLIDLPWSKETKDNLDIIKAREILEADHYGLKDVKDRIIEYLAVKNTSKTMKGPIICLVGPPGVGKTSIAKSVARAVNRNFVRMSLGGVRDEAEIRGHRRTYVGSIPGRIVYGMRQAKSKNPLFLLDEIDKMANDFRGDPADALLEVLDAEQNSTFRDHYLEVELDLSKVMFITTANTLDTVPRPLLDRMEVIEINGYTYEEKMNIAKRHLIPKVLKEHSVAPDAIRFSDNAIKFLIEGYTVESGVRNLERSIASLTRKSIAYMLEKKKTSVALTPQMIQKFLGHPKFMYEKAEKEDRIGVVTGLAWTMFGGDILPIEVTVMDGTGKLELTGQLGDVMKESAKAAYSYVRAHSAELGITSLFYKDKDIHIHVPEGAVPKDGPSAGVTMATALTSALTGKKARHNVAMTGEITLTGRVLPIGGLKEKSLAAARAGINTIIIPEKNRFDLEKLPPSILSKLTFIPVKEINEVLEKALVEVES
ncbi:endopeptidase La [Proteiniclasticum sp. BAD-10]|uniref:Lon protease n=1 Tax=Proteiniclasticum sediminis TaxID=2804028 RepID=A0A941HPW7_9CLOT|nr:endopeptidase La [Proteiniclasticum sediminis]MBR0575804.1 endopeptidase La [Proteiniclasticum sediminis]